MLPARCNLSRRVSQRCQPIKCVGVLASHEDERRARRSRQSSTACGCRPPTGPPGGRQASGPAHPAAPWRPRRPGYCLQLADFASVATGQRSRCLIQAVRERLRRTPYKVPEQRWAATFAATAPAILDVILLPPRGSKVIARHLESMLFHEAPDPNRSRKLLIERVESGVAWA